MLSECLSRGWSTMSEEGEESFYTKVEKLVVTVLKRVPRYFRHGVGTTEGFPRNSKVKAYR
jgi:hypothetical protein